MIFTDRPEAGRLLAGRLAHLRDESVVVLGLPRGGVPVAYEVAAALDAPLDVTIVRKLGVPFQPELAMGAIGEAGVFVVDNNTLRRRRITKETLRSVERREVAELSRRTALIRKVRKRVSLKGRTALIVDDGMATGATALAACAVARHLGARRVVVAVPVAAHAAVARVKLDADEVVCVEVPAYFEAVGAWYSEFPQTSDSEVLTLLQTADHPRSGAVTTR